MNTITNKLSVLTLASTVFFSSLLLLKVQALPVDLETLCQEFPLNSRCQQPQKVAPEVIKLRLDTSGPHNEWIIIIKTGNTVRLLHTTRKVTVFSRILQTAASFAPVPAPIPNFYGWRDNLTTRVVFDPDRCEKNSAPEPKPTAAILEPSNITSSCTIIGTDSIVLPSGIDIRQGSFTINYQERQLLRSITFRILPLEATNRARVNSNSTSFNGT